MNAGRTARERARAELTDEIKAVARRQLATVGAQGLSLRAVSRELGMVSSALYRYFPSRDDLLTVLIIDAYDALGEAAEAAAVKSGASFAVRSPETPDTESATGGQDTRPAGGGARPNTGPADRDPASELHGGRATRAAIRDGQPAPGAADGDSAMAVRCRGCGGLLANSRTDARRADFQSPNRQALL